MGLTSLLHLLGLKLTQLFFFFPHTFASLASLASLRSLRSAASLPRCFTLHGAVLCYYDCECLEDADPSRPRGRIDISLEGTKAICTNEWKVGAPTRFLVNLVIHSMGGIERKWKMCCRDEEQQQKWHRALSHFDGPPKRIGVGDDIMSFLSVPLTATHTHTISSKTSPKPRRISNAILGSFQKVHRR